MNSKEKAIQLYEQGLRFASASRKTNNTQVKINNIKKATYYYLQALQEDRECRPALLKVALFYSQNKKSKEALQFFLSAYKIKSDSPLCFNIASEYFKQENYAKSQKYIQESLHLDKNHLRAQLLCAYLYKQRGMPDQAERHFRRALDIDSSNRIALLSYASLVSTRAARIKEPEEILAEIRYTLKQIATYFKDRAQGAKADFLMQGLEAKLRMQVGDIKEAEAQYLELSKQAPQFQNFEKCLQSVYGAQSRYYPQFLSKVNQKIQARLADLVQTKKEKGIQHIKNNKKDVLKVLDISLLYLFRGKKGDTQRAIEKLFDVQRLHSPELQKIKRIARSPTGALP